MCKGQFQQKNVYDTKAHCMIQAYFGVEKKSNKETSYSQTLITSYQNRHIIMIIVTVFYVRIYH